MAGAEPFLETARDQNGRQPQQEMPANVRFGQRLRKVAAIDVGTNSTHLLVASVDVGLGTFSIELAEKSTTRLGEKDPDTGELTAEAMDRGMSSLRRFQELAISHQVEQIVIAATSAVREAPKIGRAHV